MSSAIKGKDVLFEVWSATADRGAGAYIPFVCATDMSISIEPEVIDTTTVSSGRGYTKKVRRIGWSLSLSGVSRIQDYEYERSVFTTVDPLEIVKGLQVRMWFTNAEGDYKRFTGKVVLQSASISGNQEDFSSFENGFSGNGLYTIETVFSALLDANGEPILNPSGKLIR